MEAQQEVETCSWLSMPTSNNCNQSRSSELSLRNMRACAKEFSKSLGRALSVQTADSTTSGMSFRISAQKGRGRTRRVSCSLNHSNGTDATIEVRISVSSLSVSSRSLHMTAVKNTSIKGFSDANFKG